MLHKYFLGSCRKKNQEKKYSIHSLVQPVFVRCFHVPGRMLRCLSFRNKQDKYGFLSQTVQSSAEDKQITQKVLAGGNKQLTLSKIISKFIICHQKIAEDKAGLQVCLIQGPSFAIREPVLSISIFVLSFKCQLHPKAGFLLVVRSLSVAFRASCFLVIWRGMGTSCCSFKIKEGLLQKSPANLSQCLIDQNQITYPFLTKSLAKRMGLTFRQSGLLEEKVGIGYL